MNLIGKIFVVLIFVMSLVFMAFAVAVYGTHQNWKEAAAKTKQQLDNAKQQQAKAEEEKTRLEAEIAREAVAKRQALAKLETERDELQQQRDATLKERDELMVKDKAAIAALDTAQQNLAKLTTEVDSLRGEIRESQAERDRHFDQVVKLTDQTHQAQGELARLKERELQLAEQISRASQVLDRHSLSIDTPLDGIPPLVRGKVLAINQDNMVEISLGRDDGLRVGHTLEIFRGDKYLGRVEVLHTETDRAVARIIPGFKKGPIQRGDDVTTRFKVS